MAEKRRFLDVWLVEPNTVYREVPFSVVTDWIQQSRLVPDDMLRPSGTAQWFRVGESPDFKPYVPQVDTLQIEDESEALESVHMDFGWKKRHDEEDDDVDMIPLIDVSLVLLIFFMLTSTAVTAAAIKNIPGAYNGLVVEKEAIYWINVDLPDGRGSTPVFSVSVGDGDAKPENKELYAITAAVTRLEAVLDGRRDVKVTIRAHKDLESGVVRDLTVELRRLGLNKKYIAVSDKVQR